jgi:hypothetical protein
MSSMSNRLPLRDSPDQESQPERILVGAHGKLAAYRYPNMWSAEQSAVLEIWTNQERMKSNNAVNRLRKLESRGLTAADILAQIVKP